jgi:dUTPase
VVPARGKAIVPTDLSIALPEGLHRARAARRLRHFVILKKKTRCCEGTYGRVAPRSGLAWKSHIDVAAGVIDRDYRGPGTLLPTTPHSRVGQFGDAWQSELCCSTTRIRISKVRNATPLLRVHVTFSCVCARLCPVAPGDRVAQLILERIAIAEVREVDELDDTYPPRLRRRRVSAML